MSDARQRPQQGPQQGMSADDQAWLLERMAELIAACGHERFVSAPIITAEDEHFPDRSNRDAAGVQVLARRLLWHAGLHDHRARVQDLRGYQVPSAMTSLSDTTVWFAGLEGQVARFELTEIGNDDIVGILSHEVGVAYRDFTGIDRAEQGHPFRDPWLQERHRGHEDEHMVNVLGSLTTVYLGLGLLATNAAHHARHAAYQAEGDWRAAGEGTQWSITTAGGLPAEAMSYLCALHAVIRADQAAYLGLLTNQRADFRRWYKELAPERESLRDRLGLPASAEWSHLDVPDPEPFEDEHYDPAGALDDDERTQFNTGKPVFRTPSKNPLGATLAGSIGAGAAFTIGLIFGGIPLGALCAVGMSGLLYRNYKIAPSFRCADLHCSALLDADEEICPRCGGTVVGLLKDPRKRLDALEEYEARLLGAGDPPEESANHDPADDSSDNDAKSPDKAAQKPD